MAGYNRIIMIGNLTRDPDYKQLASGQGVCRLGLATNRQFKNRQTGMMTQEVCFVDVDVWGSQAESCRQFLQKGKQVLVEGRLKFDTWQDPQGVTRNKHSIVADRVTFLSATTSSDGQESYNKFGDSGSDELQLDPNNPVERDLMDQLNQAKSKIKAAKKSEPKVKQDEDIVETGEIDFADTPPFEDNLPF